MRLGHQQGLAEKLDTQAKNKIERQTFCNLVFKRPRRQELQKTGTRSNDLVPEFAVKQIRECVSRDKCSCIVFVTAFVATMVCSLYAMAAVPTDFSIENLASYSVPAPKVMSMVSHGGIFELIVACFPGEAILIRPRYEKSYYGANMSKYSKLTTAMEMTCKSNGQNLMGTSLTD